MQEPQSADYPRILMIVVLMGALIACSAWILRPFIPAFIWATTIVVATWNAKQELERRLHGRRALAVTAMTLLIVLVLIVPIAIAVEQFVAHFDDMRALFGVLTSRDLPPPPQWVGRIPLVGTAIAARWTEFVSADPMAMLRPLKPYAGDIATWLALRAGSLGALLIDLLLIVVFCAILYATGDVAARGSVHFARRLSGERGVRAIRLAGSAVRAVALGIVVTAIAQSVLAGVGLALAGVPNAMLLTVVMFVLCLAQIGAIPVLAPAAIWLFWRDESAWGGFIIVWCVVVAALDNFLRPALIRRGADLPLLLIMVGVIGGVLAFGVIGLFVGPVVLAVTYTLMKLWVDEETDAAADAPAPARAAAAPRTPPPSRPRGAAKRG